MKLIKSTNGDVELYNLAQDPQEETDIYGSDFKARGLENKLDQWLELTEEPPDAPLDKKTMERLKSLGYASRDEKTK
jgi:hypothetical protein